ncbi:MAG TPA: adenylate/guanylate cyclase domain-containing protein [Anaerolineales bacterium]
MATDLPSGTVTFLFTDIEGSTRIALEHRDTWESLRARHHAILHSAFEMHAGHVFQIVGDGFCVAFHTAAEALNAAIEAQHRLKAENWGDTPIRVRMGINTGTAQAGSSADQSGGYTGYSALARTQRVMSTAYGEQILLSNASADLAREELAPDVTLRDMKEHRLKGLLNPEHLWQAVAPALAQDFPALQTLDGIPNNLPIELTSFIGREKEIAEILKLVEHHRLVTLTGSGGVGKTRHSLQIGAELLDVFVDGVWLVELSSVTDPELVLPAVANALGVREDQARPLMAALEDHLGTKSILLLLDNCEHLVDACARLADALLRACPNVKILVSSREALGIAGEVDYRVPSLALPDPLHLPSLEALSQFDSVRLFIDRATAVKSDFVVTNSNAPAVAQVCSRLDGIPLAIELAAARVKGLSAEQIASRLDDRFRLLTGGSRTAIPRHQTLRAMIEWSYDLLSESERSLLRRLGVFIGDWTLEAAEAVCAGDDPSAHTTGAIQEPEVLDLLLRLVDKSLIIADERAGQSRYRMLETIREFAREQLSTSGEEARLRARHLEFFLGFSEQAEAQLHGAEPLVWLDQLGEEYENLRAALEWARAAGSIQPAPRLAKATEQLADVQLLLGVATKAIPLYQAALALCHSVEGADPMIAARLHGKIIKTVTHLHARVDSEQFQALRAVAAVSRAAAARALEAAGAEAPSLDRVHLLTTLSADATMIRVPPDWDRAEQYARDAAEMAEKLDAPVELSAALGQLSDMYWYRGRARERVQITLRRMAISSESRFRNAEGRAVAVMDVGDALMCVGEYAQAIPYFLEAETLAAQAKAVELEMFALFERNTCLVRLDRWDEVLEQRARVNEFRRGYARERIGPTCGSIALFASVHALRGELDLARKQRQDAAEIMIEFAGPMEQWERVQHY